MTLVVPAYTDDPDILGDLAALAASIVADHYTKDQLDGRIPATMLQISGAVRVHFGSLAGATPNGSGKVVITHGAGFTPDAVLIAAGDTEAAVTASGGRIANVASASLGATTFDAWVFRNDTGAAVTSAIRLTWVCLKF